jgi:acetyltransferase-like isoleucine patch superfamily enzyme
MVREGVRIGNDCMIGSAAYIDTGVRVGNRVNIHNRAMLYRKLIIEDDVFIGPAVCVTNDPHPRSNRIRDLQGKTGRIKKGASIGAMTCILPDLTIGKYSLIGAGSIVTRNVPDYALMVGAPARLRGFVSPRGKKLKKLKSLAKKSIYGEPGTKFRISVPHTLEREIDEN